VSVQLSVSNLSWPQEDETWCLNLLKNNNIKGIEIAPLKTFRKWDYISKESCLKVQNKFNAYNLKVSSMQSITFGVNNIEIQGDLKKIENFKKHMILIPSILNNFDCSIAIFGSPGLRNITNSADKNIIELFRNIMLFYEKNNVSLGIEAVPEYYKCNFLNDFDKVSEFINEVDSNALITHFDTACDHLTAAGYVDSIEKFSSIVDNINHIHISEKDLIPFVKPSKYNIQISEIIKKNYNGKWIVLEMLDKLYTRNNFKTSVTNFCNLYKPY